MVWFDADGFLALWSGVESSRFFGALWVCVRVCSNTSERFGVVLNLLKRVEHLLRFQRLDMF